MYITFAVGGLKSFDGQVCFVTPVLFILFIYCILVSQRALQFATRLQNISKNMSKNVRLMILDVHLYEPNLILCCTYDWFGP